MCIATTVESRNINLNATISNSGETVRMSGTNCALGISWNWTSDGWEGPGQYPYPVHENVDVTNVEVTMGGETIPISLANGPTSPASRIVRFMSNHFAHDVPVQATLKVTFTLDGTAQVVTDSFMIEPYNYATLSRAPDVEMSVVSHGGPPDLLGVTAAACSSSKYFVNRNQDSVLPWAFEFHAILEAYQPSTLYYTMSHGNYDAYGTLGPAVTITAGNMAQAKSTEFPKTNIAVFDCCHIGKTILEGNYLQSGSVLYGALQTSQYLAPLLVNRAAGGWTIYAYFDWISEWVNAFWGAFESGLTIEESTSAGIASLPNYPGDDQVGPPAESQVGLDGITQEYGSRIPAFYLIGDLKTTLNSLYNPTLPESTWYEVTNGI